MRSRKRLWKWLGLSKPQSRAISSTVIQVVDSLDQLLGHRIPIIPRAPIIPGVNDTPSHAAALRRWEAHPGIAAVERLPYHDTGKAKYADLGKLPPEILS